MEFVQLRCFVAVAEEKSFTKAALRLQYATSNVSQHVHHLEKEVGTPLLDRANKSVWLTPAGEILFKGATQLLADLEVTLDAARQAALGQAGLIRGAFCPGSGIVVAELIRTAGAAYPNIQIVFNELPTSHILKAVRNGEISLGIARETDSELGSLVLITEQRATVILPSGHRLSESACVDIKQLDGERILVVDRKTSRQLHDRWVHFFEEHGVQVQFQPAPLNTIEEMILRVATGQGVLIGNDEPKIDCAQYGVVVRPVRGPVPSTDFYMIWRREDTLPQVALLVELLRSRNDSPPADVGRDPSKALT
jgi:DNA-binding transcriptional LysR family regulator